VEHEPLRRNRKIEPGGYHGFYIRYFHKSGAARAGCSIFKTSNSSSPRGVFSTISSPPGRSGVPWRGGKSNSAFPHRGGLHRCRRSDKHATCRFRRAKSPGRRNDTVQRLNHGVDDFKPLKPALKESDPSFKFGVIFKPRRRPQRSSLNSPLKAAAPSGVM